MTQKRQREVIVHIIDRSNPHEKVMWVPEENVEKYGYSKAGDYTRLEAIQESVHKRGYWAGRTDIALVNVTEADYCNHCGRGGHYQLAVEPTLRGPEEGEAWQYLSEEQKQQVREINQRMIEAAQAPETRAMSWLFGMEDVTKP